MKKCPKCGKGFIALSNENIADYVGYAVPPTLYCIKCEKVRKHVK